MMTNTSTTKINSDEKLPLEETLAMYHVASTCLKLVRTMLETWNLVHKYFHTYVVLENIPFSIKKSLVLLISAFFCKETLFFVKNNTFTQSSIMIAA